jgi:hypothetical protein
VTTERARHGRTFQFGKITASTEPAGSAISTDAAEPNCEKPDSFVRFLGHKPSQNE